MKVLVIVGPTAVGKTNLALSLAKHFDGELVSCDSRQVYYGMDIATGKDIPKGSKFKKSNRQNFGLGFWETQEGIRIWLTDIVSPKEKFSVAQFVRLAEKVVADIYRRGKLPILVGGTGLYIKALTDGIQTLEVPPNPDLRAAYEKKTADELFEILLHLNPSLVALNTSERKNKQRLIRKIEIESAYLAKKSIDRRKKKMRKLDTLFIGLNAPREVLKEKIWKRIDFWVKKGIEDEVKNLIVHGVSWSDQSMSALGYRQWQPYFQHKATKEAVIARWKHEEWQYARRQLTWFKKDTRIHWFDVTVSGWQNKVENMVEKWYHS
jgi:tRNA dimethylallyltransferase